MIIDKVLIFEQKAINQCEALVKRDHWAILTALILPISVLFFSFPSVYSMHCFQTENWQAILEQTRHPFTENNYPEHLHHSKLTFRLTIPLIAHVLHLGIPGILGLQVSAGILLFYVSAKLSERIVNDRITALLLTLLISFTYAGRTSFIETRGMFDGLAILFLLAAMYNKNPFLITLNVLLTAWTDERGLIASCLVFFYWSIQETANKKTKLVAIVTAWIIYFISRIYISTTFGLHTSTGLVGWSVFVNQINNLPIGVWTGLEGGWFLVSLSLIMLLAEKKHFQMLIYLGGILTITVTAMCVIDITRSMAYLLPALFVSLSFLSKTESVYTLRRCVLIAAVLTFIYPAYYVGSNYYSYWTYPLPLQILRYIFIL